MIRGKDLHTPAPWIVSVGVPGASDQPYFCVSTVDGKLIANCGSAGEANAKHIIKCVSGITLIHSILTNSREWNADTLDNIAEVLNTLGLMTENTIATHAE
jgi:hypothetical protein